jgi:chromosome segregation ATPase
MSTVKPRKTIIAELQDVKALADTLQTEKATMIAEIATLKEALQNQANEQVEAVKAELAKEQELTATLSATIDATADSFNAMKTELETAKAEKATLTEMLAQLETAQANEVEMVKVESDKAIEALKLTIAEQATKLANPAYTIASNEGRVEALTDTSIADDGKAPSVYQQYRTLKAKDPREASRFWLKNLETISEEIAADARGDK